MQNQGQKSTKSCFLTSGHVCSFPMSEGWEQGKQASAINLYWGGLEKLQCLFAFNPRACVNTMYVWFRKTTATLSAITENIQSAVDQMLWKKHGKYSRSNMLRFITNSFSLHFWGLCTFLIANLACYMFFSFLHYHRIKLIKAFILPGV